MLAWEFTTVIATQKGIVLVIVPSFDASNLADVVRALQVQHPARLIVLAGDNDHGLPRRDPPLPNVGEVKAQGAAAGAMSEPG